MVSSVYSFKDLHWAVKVLTYLSFAPALMLLGSGVIDLIIPTGLGITLVIIGILYLLVVWISYNLGIVCWEIAERSGKNTDLAYTVGLVVGVLGIGILLYCAYKLFTYKKGQDGSRTHNGQYHNEQDHVAQPPDTEEEPNGEEYNDEMQVI